MKDRLKQLRKVLGLTQAEFGARIGIKQSSVALIETGRPTSDRTITGICKEFGVRREWLVDGEGEMFAPKENTALDQLAKEFSLSPEETAMVRRFVTLQPEVRRGLLDFLKGMSSGTVRERDPPDGDLSLAELQARLEDQYEAEKRRADESAASGA